MTAISDFLYALRTRRSYRGPMELSQIASMMRDMMGIDLLSGLASNFLNII